MQRGAFPSIHITRARDGHRVSERRQQPQIRRRQEQPTQPSQLGVDGDVGPGSPVWAVCLNEPTVPTRMEAASEISMRRRRRAGVRVRVARVGVPVCGVYEEPWLAGGCSARSIANKGREQLEREEMDGAWSTEHGLSRLAASSVADPDRPGSSREIRRGYEQGGRPRRAHGHVLVFQASIPRQRGSVAWHGWQMPGRCCLG